MIDSKENQELVSREGRVGEFGLKSMQAHIDLLSLLSVANKEIEFAHRCLVTPLWREAIQEAEDEGSLLAVAAFRTVSEELLLFDYDQLRIDIASFALEYFNLGNTDSEFVSKILIPLVGGHS